MSWNMLWTPDHLPRAFEGNVPRQETGGTGDDQTRSAVAANGRRRKRMRVEIVVMI